MVVVGEAALQNDILKREQSSYRYDTVEQLSRQ